MKSILIILFLLFSFFLKEKPIKVTNENTSFEQKLPIPPLSLLDSLQGTWVSIGDSLNRVIINQRDFVELYANDQWIINKNRIFFSDTLVQPFSDWNTVRIDTSRVNGNYLIKLDLSDSSVWCYTFNGFYKDVDISFSISDTWAKRRAVAYKKN